MNRYINESDKKMDELLQKYIAGNASEKESQRIMEWLREDEQHLREYKRQRKLYDITLWQTKSPVDIRLSLFLLWQPLIFTLTTFYKTRRRICKR